MIIVALVVLLAGGIYWADTTEDRCWQSEAAQVFEHYQMLKSRSAILREAASTGRDITNSKSNSVELIEKEPNGCSVGSNGRTVVRFYFDNAENLTTMQVFRAYVAADYTMEMIDERRF
jgi:hypothetical protein